MTLKDIENRLKELQDPKNAEILKRYFKTGKGEYGEGDIFWGIRVPVLRKEAGKYLSLPLKDVETLIKTEIHEQRMLAILILVKKYAQKKEQNEIYKLYMRNTEFINNWDLVDLSADKIVGDFLKEKDRKPIYDLSVSKILWDRRIAIMATFNFIKNNDFSDTLKLAELFIQDKEDLIHKATGWMLREIGKRDIVTEENFLKIHYKNMPRVMLRYAIERFPELRRQKYLKGTI